VRAVFIGGCPRSGTTLLGTLLAAFLDCTVTPESQFKNEWFRYGKGRDPWEFVVDHPRFKVWKVPAPPPPSPPAEDIGRAVAHAVAAYAGATGQDPNAPWIDHTPSNLRFAATFARIPGWEIRFVHIVRDGRAVAASVMPLDWGPNTSIAAGRFWASETGVALGAEQRYPDRVLRVRYEDLLGDTEGTIEAIAGFAGLKPRPGGPDFDTVRMPDYYTQSYHRLVHQGVDKERSEAWRSKLRPRDVELIEFSCGELLDFLGYASDYGVAARPPHLVERARLGLRETWLETSHAFTWVRNLRRGG
jgi:hypothetical protein